MGMYEKDLCENFRLRLSTTDMDYLKRLSEKRCVSVSEVVRSIIGEHRRSYKLVDLMSKAMDKVIEEDDVHGNTEAVGNDKL